MSRLTLFVCVSVAVSTLVHACDFGPGGTPVDPAATTAPATATTAAAAGACPDETGIIAGAGVSFAPPGNFETGELGVGCDFANTLGEGKKVLSDGNGGIFESQQLYPCNSGHWGDPALTYDWQCKTICEATKIDCEGITNPEQLTTHVCVVGEPDAMVWETITIGTMPLGFDVHVMGPHATKTHNDIILALDSVDFSCPDADWPLLLYFSIDETVGLFPDTATATATCQADGTWDKPGMFLCFPDSKAS